MVSRDNKVHYSVSSLFFVDFYKFWSSGWELVTYLYLKIPEDFVRLIFQERFGVAHMPFVRMIKSKLLAQFPVDHHAHLVVPSLILFFWSSLLHSLIMWLVVSCLSPHNIHLLFCCVLSILAFSRRDSALCISHLLAWSNFNFLNNSLQITLPRPVLSIIFFHAYLLHSVIMWLIVSSLSPHNLHYSIASYLFPF